MSKTLSKVMIICAMIIILPLMIVGTTYAAYYSIDAKIAFDIYTNRVCTAQGAYAKVYANGKEAQENSEIVDGHLKDVKFNASAEGYDFIGWFNGDEMAYALAMEEGNVEFVSTDAAFKTAMTDYDKLLAVFNVKEYDVTYTRSLETPDSIELPQNARLSWGDSLPTLTYNGYDKTFAGWKVEGSEQIVNTVNFETSNINLLPVWKEQNKVSITYMNNQTKLSSTEVYLNEPYTVQTVESVVSSRKAGFEYAWKDAQGNAISAGTEISSDEDIVIYLDEKAINYTVTLNDEELSYKNNTTITFNATDFSQLRNVFDAKNYIIPYSYFEFVGISMEDVNYANAGTLGDYIINNNPNGLTSEITLTVKANKYFKNVQVNGMITGKVGYVGKVYKEDAVGTDLEWSVPGSTKASNLTLNEFLYLKNGDKITKLYTGTSSDNKQEVRISGVKVSVDGNLMTVQNLTGESTLNDIIAEILKVSQTELTETFVIDSLQVYFEKV